jgi:nitrile hydratase subunit beta
MNGAHDMGGRMGFGVVVAELNEQVFHNSWQARFFALANALGEFEKWTLDEDRHLCENRTPAEYLRNSYYETWLAALERLIVAKGLVSEQELASGKVCGQAQDVLLCLKADRVWAAVTANGSYLRRVASESAFEAGDFVRARNLQPRGHTRLPAYLRGHVGEVVRCHGAHVFPDSNAHGFGEDPQWLYCVRFAASALWNNGSGDHMHADLWEPYLEPA